MLKTKLVEKFGEGILHNSLMWYENDESDFIDLIKGLKIRNCIEIGTYNGLSTAILSQYSDFVYTIDIKDNLEKYEVWDYLQIKNIKAMIIKNNFEKEEIINSINDVDLVFIDGWHWHGQCEYDYNLCKNINHKIIHDYNDVHYEIKNFVNSLKCNKKIKGNLVLL